MEDIYNLIQANPKYFAWAFGVLNVLWIGFTYFNRQSHDKAMERLKTTLQLRQAEFTPVLMRLIELEEIAGEAKELITSYKAVEERRDSYWPLRAKLEQLTGQLSKYPKLMQSIRDFSHFGAILVQDDPHNECRSEVLQYFDVLLTEIENVKQQSLRNA